MLSQSGPSSLPHLPFLAGAASQGTPSAQGPSSSMISHSPSATVAAQSSYIPSPSGYPVAVNVQPNPAQQPLASPQANMDSAMAKRDAIAKRLSMMGPGGSAASSVLSAPYSSDPMQSNQFSAPSDIQNLGPSNQRTANGVTPQFAQGGYRQAERAMDYPNIQTRVPVAEASSNVTPQGSTGNRFGQSHNGTSASNAESIRNSSTWNADSDRSARSRSPHIQYSGRQGAFQSDRAPLTSRAERDEFGRDRMNRRSASPRRNGADGRDSKRIRTGEADYDQLNGQTEVSLREVVLSKVLGISADPGRLLYILAGRPKGGTGTRGSRRDPTESCRCEDLGDSRQCLDC
jgi:hypothetical protein